MNEGVADQAAPLDQAILFRGDLAIPIKDLAEKVIGKGGRPSFPPLNRWIPWLGFWLLPQKLTFGMGWRTRGINFLFLRHLASTSLLCAVIFLWTWSGLYCILNKQLKVGCNSYSTGREIFDQQQGNRIGDLLKYSNNNQSRNHQDQEWRHNLLLAITPEKGVTLFAGKQKSKWWAICFFWFAMRSSHETLYLISTQGVTEPYL